MRETPQKTVARRFYEEVWNRRALDRLGDILHEDFTFRGSLGPVLRGHTAFAGSVDEVHSALAEYRCFILDLVGEGEKVVARPRFHGLHRGPLLGIPATGGASNGPAARISHSPTAGSPISGSSAICMRWRGSSPLDDC